MSIKLTDVAKKAGVSPTTVSRVINNYGSLSQKTIDKVQAAMGELNYQPNSLARSLQGKNTQLVGLIFPTIAHPFFAELVEQLETKLFEHGYKTILCNSAQNKEKERSYLKMLAANKVDGIIAGAHNLGIKEYETIELPIISFDRYLAEGIPIVGSDNYQGGYLATETLYKNGGKRIGIIAGSNVSDSPTNERLNGYLAFLEEVGLTPTIFRFAPFENSLTLKNMKIKQILEKRDMDSLFCTDDLTATLVINNCRELGIDIPKQLKVIGYDGTQFMQSYFPDLTTIAQPIQDFTDLLVDLLIQRITQPDILLEDMYKLPVKVSNGKTV
ncbi:LacI family DNA-binding transcriptional regulator [Tetragenococcus koreensis]|uniref:LacI family DNA-binding transcriptional regulator n=1 Tax=Tetragenococcus koreensis TaxID=290335 RepID=UPI000F4DDF5F|nr:LacI family DNA-binding transcriptional regulator [Tetragenococcus koreensis]AYW44747.1 LacI family transcriptional regulator [Tetragenococcus koreensis]GEN91910.1 LacI family transcriptional regulator [Tetragenococcus koreensis]